MNPWAILEINPITDARAIKRAYAKKLKQTRPDEKPEEFQALHAAYKQALKLAEQLQEEVAGQTEASLETPSLGQAENTNHEKVNSERVAVLEGAQEAEVRAPTDEVSTPLAAEEHPAKQEGVSDPLEQSEGVSPDTQPSESREAQDLDRDLRIEEFRRVLKQVDEMLNNHLEMSLERSWDFLTKSPYMLDEEYNWNLGLSVFERFAQFNQNAVEGGKSARFRPQVTPNILQYCDQLFDWRGNASYLYQALDEKLCNSIFNSLEVHESRIDPLQGLRGGGKVEAQSEAEFEGHYEKYFFGDVVARGVAFFLDLVMTYMAVGSLATAAMMKIFGLPEAVAAAKVIPFCFGAYLLFAWLFECSKLQATPGKYIMGYRVTSQKFGRIGYLRGLWRTVSFAFTSAFGLFAWIINFFLVNKLLHDRLSRTYVINMRKTHEEHLRRLRKA
ncbi:RDD family protein [Microbulbifer sp. ZKSA002]|uniref:RDD family protein n=1 Tax=Microbulbifer sp. ZKSA002 TaxID=3243388 RepID=UPI0040399048